MPPIWVIILFFVLLRFGIKRCFARKMRPQWLFLLPLIFFVLSLRHFSLVDFDLSLELLCWGFGIIFGIFLGYLHVRRIPVGVDEEQDLVEIPGDWTLLVLILGIFAVEYVVNYLKAISSPIVYVPWFLLLTAGIAGLIVGMTFGRNGTYFYKFRFLDNKIRREI